MLHAVYSCFMLCVQHAVIVSFFLPPRRTGRCRNRDQGVRAVHGSVVVGARVLREQKASQHCLSSHLSPSHSIWWASLIGVYPSVQLIEWQYSVRTCGRVGVFVVSCDTSEKNKPSIVELALSLLACLAPECQHKDKTQGVRLEKQFRVEKGLNPS